MPATPATYANVIARMDSVIFNPSRNFLKDADYQQYIDAAVLDTALEVGGLRFIDATTLTVAGQRDYVLDSKYKRLNQAQYVQNIGATNEIVNQMDVITERDSNFLSVISQPVSGFDPSSLDVTGTPQVISKYAVFWPEIQTMRLLDTPDTANDTIKLWVLGLPHTMGTGITYDGDASDMNALVFRACDLARLKSRETQESSVWEQKWLAECERIRRFRGKINRVRQIQDGRYRITRLRSVNGSK